MAVTPTTKTLQLLRKEGYTAQVVEKYVHFIKRRIDLFGFIDVVGIRPDIRGVLAVQTTSGSNLAKRIKKAMLLPAMRTWLEADNGIEFHGWRKMGKAGKRKLWQCDRRIFTLKDLDDMLD